MRFVPELNKIACFSPGGGRSLAGIVLAMALGWTLSGCTTSVVVDTTGCANGIAWAYFGKRGPEQPDASDYLEQSWLGGGNAVVFDTWFGGSTDPVFLQRVLGATVNGTTYAGMRARTTGAPQNHWFGPAGDPRGAGIGTPEAIKVTWSCHREIIMDQAELPDGWQTPASI